MNITNNTLERSAGILLHISSLPGRYSCGDFGPAAYTFARKLKQAGQKYWQILPLNPLDSTKGFSPYSPLSAFAGNPLFISVEKLKDSGYLKKISKIKKSASKQVVDYESAISANTLFLQEAFSQFRKNPSESETRAFQDFCRREEYWLDDFALYSSIRESLQLPWYQWPITLRDRDPQTLEKEKEARADELEFVKFSQFLFTEQWSDLKNYCHKQGIRIIGDIPIYISHDSADVWAHPKYFKLTTGKSIDKNAGVPPDYFNDKGQLWNMPVYDWEVLENSHFSWWIDRLKKNLELYDVVRLDHFRGFSSFWEVDGSAEDAINGAWSKGPGKRLFKIIQKAFPDMPFIAEDLGDIDQAVFDLRDAYDLPGMRILQFAFEGDMPKSIFIPHNYSPNSVVYTGTHDNNTVRGWFRKELSKKGKKNLSKYLNQRITNKNCHSIMIQEAYRSVARMAVIPMQDILGLGAKHRMNYPSTETGNWLWQMRSKDFKKKHIKKLKMLSETFGRS